MADPAAVGQGDGPATEPKSAGTSATPGTTGFLQKQNWPVIATERARLCLSVSPCGWAHVHVLLLTDSPPPLSPPPPPRPPPPPPPLRLSARPCGSNSGQRLFFPAAPPHGPRPPAAVWSGSRLPTGAGCSATRRPSGGPNCLAGWGCSRPPRWPTRSSLRPGSPARSIRGFWCVVIVWHRLAARLRHTSLTSLHTREFIKTRES
eukprot:SAG22_NODE_5680_length_972_cov_1.371134_1_plen_205_part_00